MNKNTEGYSYDFRKGGDTRSKPAKKKAAPKAATAKPTGDLTAAKRRKLANSAFGLPESRGYPMPDKKHARLAKSGSSHAKHVGNISSAEKAEIDAKANRILGKKGERK
ncbi:MAG: hypothetical protein ACLPX8_09560 [Bryobacteraceae bacterium]